MRLYETIQEAYKLAQTYNDPELLGKLMEARAHALNTQEELMGLRQENEKLRKIQITELDIERHDEPYITLKSDENKIPHCATCWDQKHELIQLQKQPSGLSHLIGTHECPICKTKVNYTK